jgi:hypothetical protein
MRDGMLAAWRNQVQGARALAMARTRAALYGGDADARQRLAVAFLTAIDSSSSGRTAWCGWQRDSVTNMRVWPECRAAHPDWHMPQGQRLRPSWLALSSIEVWLVQKEVSQGFRNVISTASVGGDGLGNRQSP